MKRAHFDSIGSAWLLCFVPVLAWAADQVLIPFDPSTGRFWITFAMVQVLNLLGYGASSLPQLASWIDEGTAREVLEKRLTIVQGVLVSIMAGNIAYYAGRYSVWPAVLPANFGATEIVCFISAAVAAYGGDKFLSPLLSRITGRAAVL